MHATDYAAPRISPKIGATSFHRQVAAVPLQSVRSVIRRKGKGYVGDFAAPRRYLCESGIIAFIAVYKEVAGVVVAAEVGDKPVEAGEVIT
jgi:hypothetical protein